MEDAKYKTVTCLGLLGSDKPDYRYWRAFSPEELADDHNWEQFEDNLLAQLRSARQEILDEEGTN